MNAIYTLFELMSQLYGFGFSGVVPYLLVGLGTGAFVVLVNTVDCTWDGYKTWNWNVLVFITGRFVAGAVIWPMLLFALPLVALVLVLLALLVVVGLVGRLGKFVYIYGRK